MGISEKCTEGLTDCQKILLANTHTNDFDVFLFLLIISIILVGVVAGIIELWENYKSRKASINRGKTKNK